MNCKAGATTAWLFVIDNESARPWLGRYQTASLEIAKYLPHHTAAYLKDGCQPGLGR
jgi:hypothetical protein